MTDSQTHCDGTPALGGAAIALGVRRHRFGAERSSERCGRSRLLRPQGSRVVVAASAVARDKEGTRVAYASVRVATRRLVAVRAAQADPHRSGDPAGAPRIATVPFTLRNFKGDLEDVGSRFDGAPDLEFRLATEALELERSGLGYQRVPPGYRFPYGHTHRKQEEVYVVLRGSGRMKLDDEIVELKEWDAVRVPPGTWRGYEAGPEGLELLVIGAPNLGEAPREDVEGERDWWAG